MRKILMALLLVLGAVLLPRNAHAARVARITYYTEQGPTYSGYWTAPGTAACSWNIPLYTRLLIDGWYEVQCLDRGRLGWSDWVDISAPDGASWVPESFGDWATIEEVAS